MYSNKDKIVMIFLLVFLCIMAVLYGYLFYENHQNFLNGNDLKHLKIEYFNQIVLDLFKLFTIILFAFNAIIKRWYEKVSNLFVVNFLLIIPSILLVISKYIAVPVLFSKSMMLFNIFNFYLFGNLAYLVSKGIIALKKVDKSN